MLIQPQSFEDGLRDAQHIGPTRGSECLLRLCIAVHDRLPVPLVECRVHHPCFDLRDLLLELHELTALATEFLFDRLAILEVPDLCEIGHPQARGEIDVTNVLTLFADGVQQGGLPSTVVAHDADAVPIHDRESDVLQHIHGTEGAIHAIHGDEFTCHRSHPVARVDASRTFRTGSGLRTSIEAARWAMEGPP